MALKLAIVPFWKDYDRKLNLRIAERAEDLGYDSIWIPEAWGYEQFQLLTEVALATKTLKVATGIANIFSRSPALLAMSAATLDEISEGRAILGVGTSGKNVVENLHGIEFKKPLTRMRQTIGILRALWSGQRLQEDMAFWFEPRHFQLAMKPVRTDIPIHIAALNEKSLVQTGEIADGWIPTFWPYKHFKDGLDLLAKGAEKAGKDPSSVKLTPFVSVVPTDDLDMARSLIKPAVSFYIGGMGTYYHQMFCRYGFEENANLVRELYNSPDRKKAAPAVSDELIDAIAICGPPEHCKEKLQEWHEHGVDTAIVNVPQGVPYEMCDHLLGSIAP